MKGKRHLPCANLEGPHLRVKVEPKPELKDKPRCDACRALITGILFISKGKSYCENCWWDNWGWHIQDESQS